MNGLCKDITPFYQLHPFIKRQMKMPDHNFNVTSGLIYLETLTPESKFQADWCVQL